MRRATKIPALLALCALSALVSCQVISGLNDYEFVDSTDASAGTGGGTSGSGGSGGNVGGSGGNAASAGGGSAGTDGGVSEAPCDSSETPAADAIFVSPNGLDSNNGKPDFPVQTLTTALSLAKANFATHIYLEASDYAFGETLVLGAAEGGIVIEGGWAKSGPNWAPKCEPGRRALTTLVFPSAIAVRVQDIDKPGALRHLKISTKANGDSTDGQPGEPMFGVWVSGVKSAFNLYDVEVIAGNAGNGGASLAQAAPSGTAACNGLNDCCTTEAGCGNTTVGPSPPDPPTSVGNDAQTTGTFDATGYVAANGDQGPSGSNGYNGQKGGAGDNKGSVCVSPAGCCGYTSPSCSTGCNGTQPCTGTTPLKAEDGKCGCGGLGGLGGMGGRGGGASVALLVTDGATVTVEYSSFHAGNGGDGSLGGDGGPAAPGGDGMTGGGTYCTTSCGSCPNCGNDTSANGGTPGTKGGYGAVGGKSGAGAGGPSYSYVAASATMSDNGNNVFIFSLGGSGAGNAASGPEGVTP